LSELMQLFRLFANFIDRTRSELLVVFLVLIALIPSPIQFLFLLAMTMNTFWAQAIYNILVRRRQHHPLDHPTTVSPEDTCSFTVYEQQRWWLAKWSDKLMDGSFPWLDPTNPTDNCPRESFTLPMRTKWDGPWRVETGSMTDADGWQYAQEFGQKFWTSKRAIKDFVRRRKWVRKFVKE